LSFVLCLSALASDFTITSYLIGHNAGSNGVCPGKYQGQATFTNGTPAMWGWIIDTNSATHTITDTNRSDTHIIVNNRLGTISYCDQTTVTITNTSPTEKWRPTPYFPSNVPPTSYSLTFHGFIQ
jgi:hypothetical protein